MGLFKDEPTLDELESEHERLQKQREVLKSKVDIATLKKRLDERGGKGFWKVFSTNQKADGFNVGKAFGWLRSH